MTIFSNLPLAKALLRQFGDFAGVISASAEELAQVPGLGQSSIASLKAVQAAALKLIMAPLSKRPVLASWQHLLDYCRASMAYLKVEQLRLIYLDRQNKLIADEVMQQGTVDHTPVYPREVVKRALDLGAAAIIMVHNHPGGDSKPSEADIIGDILFSQTDALKWSVDTQPQQAIETGELTHFIVTNPPYGERLGELATLLPMFVKWGEQLKAHFANWHVSMLTSNRELLRQLRLRSNKEYAMMNGKLECKCVNYQLNESNCTAVEQHSGQQDFANRLKKNLKRLKGFIQSNVTDCYRIYDADLPEYNCAIDRYADWLVVQEYAPPKDIPAEKARRRLHDVLLQLPMLTGVSTDKIVLKVREQQKGKAQYDKFNSQHERIIVQEHGAQFYVNLHDYLDTGLFLDHRITRQRFAQDVQGMRVLNLFSYTGSVSVHAALGKAASVTTVDMSNTYLDWAKDNFRLNQLRGGYDFQQGDCLSWIKHHSKQYERIFIDPPSFSNSKRMSKTWDVQRDHVSLIRDALGCLTRGGKIYFSNNLRSFKLDTEALQDMGFAVEDITAATIPEDYIRNPKIHHCWILTLEK